MDPSATLGILFCWAAFEAASKAKPELLLVGDRYLLLLKRG